MSYSAVDQKIEEAISLLSQIRLRIRSEYDVIQQERQRLGISPQPEIDTEPDQEIPNEGIPTLSSLKPIFAQLLNTVQECEEAISQNSILSRDFVLQIARSLMTSQKELQVALDSTQIPELNSPFQGVGMAMKLAVNGDLSQLGETLGLLKQLPQCLVDAGYIQKDIGGGNMVVGPGTGVWTGPEMTVIGNVPSTVSPPDPFPVSSQKSTVPQGKPTQIPKPTTTTTTTKTTKYKPKLTTKEAKDLEKSTSFGKEELKKLHVAFKSHDRNRTGRLDQESFKQLVRSLQLFPGISDQTLENFFFSFDTDGSGTVEFPELATSLSVIGKGTPEEKLAFMFDSFDTDRSGFLDRKEVLAVMEQMKVVAEALGRDPRKIEPFVEGVLRKADADSSGEISREEWIHAGQTTPSLLVLLAGEEWGGPTPASSVNISVGRSKSVKKKPLKLSAATTKELQSKTAYGKKELQDLEKMFKKVDKDKSGDLNKEEFKKLIKELRMLPGVSDGTLESFFVSFDVDGSGSVDFAELATALSVLGKGSGEEKLSFLFDVYDADKSGVLEAAEITAVINQMKVVAEALGRDPRKMEPFIQNILKKAEGTDGRITKVEWMRVGQSTPSLLSLLAGGEWT